MIPFQQQRQQEQPQQQPLFVSPAMLCGDQAMMLMQASEAFFLPNVYPSIPSMNVNVEPTPINPCAPVQVGDVNPRELLLSDMLDFSFASHDDINDDDVPLFGMPTASAAPVPSVVSNSELFKSNCHHDSSLYTLMSTTPSKVQQQPFECPPVGMTLTLSSAATTAYGNHNGKKRRSVQISEDEESSCESRQQTIGSNASSTIGVTKKFKADDHDDDLVDLSTSHIAALCSDKGPALCHDIIDCDDPADTSHMTDAEKALASKDRNRMHARNTRIRKKAYVDLLKQTLLNICAQRDAHVEQRVQEQQTQLETRAVRFSYAQELLQCKARNEPSLARWKVVCDDAIRVTGGAMDAAGLPQVVLTPCMSKDLVGVRCDRGSLLMDGDYTVLEWNCGTNSTRRGTLKCQFHPTTNKIVQATIVVAANPTEA